MLIPSTESLGVVTGLKSCVFWKGAYRQGTAENIVAVSPKRNQDSSVCRSS